jgi:hypothetical protein
MIRIDSGNGFVYFVEPRKIMAIFRVTDYGDTVVVLSGGYSIRVKGKSPDEVNEMIRPKWDIVAGLGLKRGNHGKK